MHSTDLKALFKTFLLALSLFSLSSLVIASDLSLPTYDWAQDAALQNDPNLANDPLSEFIVKNDGDIWARIRKGFGIPDLANNPLVENQITWYTSHPDYIERTTQRGSIYLYHLVEELEKRGMPTELALLPFIESAFNPQAYSSAKAAGMWQFIPSTGRDFNLKQNMFKDERRSVIASTDAALTYLQKLYDMFGDWQLALAAYNWGEGAVQRAIKQNEARGLPIDFNSLSARMPAETRNYVPKLQAIKDIIASPETYGITLPKIDNQPYFVAVAKTRDIDVKLAAKLAELPIDQFKALNPQFNRPVITGSANTQILLPESNAAIFKANLAKWTHALSSWTAHRITDARVRIETIAAKFHTTPEVIREANNIPPRMELKAGSTILVPRIGNSDTQQDISPEVADNAKLALVPVGPTMRRVRVTVRRHDTLLAIAHRYRVSVDQIKDWNDLHRNGVRAGEHLELHVPVRIASASSSRPKNRFRHRQASRSVKSHTMLAKAHSRHVRGRTRIASTKFVERVASK